MVALAQWFTTDVVEPLTGINKQLLGGWSAGPRQLVKKPSGIAERLRVRGLLTKVQAAMCRHIQIFPSTRIIK